MVSNQLADTRVELLEGSAIVESAEPTSGTSVTLLYKNWSMRFPERGVFRIDSDPPRLWVVRGQAEVSAGNKGDAQLIAQGMSVPFAQVLVPARSTEHPRDSLTTWAEGRHQSISADNAIAANIQDPASLTLTNPDINSFTQFPMLGLSSASSSSSGVYGPLSTYQPGFNSIYLPGYTYFPNYTYLLLLPATIHSGLYLLPNSPAYVGGLSSVPLRAPHSTIGSPLALRPITPSSTTMQSIAPRPLPVGPVGSHPGPVSPTTSHPVPARPAASPR
jgi:hypothetical protein